MLLRTRCSKPLSRFDLSDSSGSSACVDCDSITDFSSVKVGINLSIADILRFPSDVPESVSDGGGGDGDGEVLLLLIVDVLELLNGSEAALCNEVVDDLLSAFIEMLGGIAAEVLERSERPDMLLLLPWMNRDDDDAIDVLKKLFVCAID